MREGLPSSAAVAGTQPHLLRQAVDVERVVAVQASGVVQLPQRVVPRRRLRAHCLAARQCQMQRACSGHAAGQDGRRHAA